MPYANGAGNTVNGRTNSSNQIELVRTYIDNNGDYWMMVIGDATQIANGFTLKLYLNNNNSTVYRQVNIAGNSDTSILWNLGANLNDATAIRLKPKNGSQKIDSTLGAFKVSDVTLMNPAL